MSVALDSYIQATEGTRGGKPRITGTRVAVIDVAIMHLHFGQPLEQIAGDHQLPLPAVYAAMAYYYEHRDEIEKRLAEDERFAEEFLATHPAVLRTTLDTARDRLKGGKT